jgi:hypothetical protein
MSTYFEISLENPERLEQWLKIKPDFEREAKALFLQTVFEIHKYLIRVSPMDTGELRGGWTGILNKYNQDYSVALMDTSLYDHWKSQNKSQYGKEYHFTLDQVLKGAGQSQFEDSPLDITVINSVLQGDIMENGTSKIQGRHTTELARYKGEYWFNKNFNEWFEQIAKEEKIVKPQPQITKQLT